MENHRPKALYRGRYFPCFGILCGPLVGTEIFPLPPRMEKLHYAVAKDLPLDHYDGEPQSQYLDDIKTYMDPILKSQFTSNRTNFLFRQNNDSFEVDWQRKFPYASHRFGEHNAVRKHIRPEERFNKSSDEFSLFQNYSEGKLIDPSVPTWRGKGTKESGFNLL